MPNINFALYMLICLLTTIIVELLVSLILGVRYKLDIINIVLVNILTNPLVVSLINLISINHGKNIAYVFLFIFELIVVFIEGFIYKKYLDFKKIKPILLSFILNLSSYLVGLLIQLFI